MKAIDRTRLIVIVPVFLALLALAYWGAPAAAGTGKVGAWYSVIPPLLAVALAFLTQHIFLSLGVAVLLGGLLAKMSIGSGVVAVAQYGWGSVSDTFNLQVLLFVALILAMIAVIVVAGGLKALVQWLSQYARGRRSTKVVTVIMGFVIFIDDYANTMIVGSAMRSMTDHYKISREKLAFLVDATSAPIAGIAIVSTWIGYEVGLFNQVSETLALNKTGYAMFFDALGYRFYCLLMIAFVVINAISGRDFAGMLKAEKRALHKGEVMARGAKVMGASTYKTQEPAPESQAKIRSAVLPIGCLLIYLFAGLWWDGGGLKYLQESPINVLKFSVWRDVLSQSENNVTVLWQAALTGLLVALITAGIYSRVQMKTLLKAASIGFRSSLLPALILVLSWSLKMTCDDLQTGGYLVSSLGEFLSPQWFPALVFIVSGLTAFATGTSWGTMSILIPTVVPLASQLDGGGYGLTTIICLGAILDGAIWGDHCSPISDTTIMSSISSHCDHIHHVETQLPYSLLVGLVALLVCYLPAAMGASSAMTWSLGVVIFAGVFWLFGRDPTHSPT